jgi:hypothetical protein
MTGASVEGGTEAATSPSRGHTGAKPGANCAWTDAQLLDAVTQRSTLESNLNRIVSVVGSFAQEHTNNQGLRESLPGEVLITNTDGSRTISLKLGEGERQLWRSLFRPTLAWSGQP